MKILFLVVRSSLKPDGLIQRTMLTHIKNATVLNTFATPNFRMPNELRCLKQTRKENKYLENMLKLRIDFLSFEHIDSIISCLIFKENAIVANLFYCTSNISIVLFQISF